MAPRAEDSSFRRSSVSVAADDVSPTGSSDAHAERCDYLVVGAGTSGMSFVDTILTENPKATLIIVDRNEMAGGHWVHAYPFVKLHQQSCNYGVNSMPLGKHRTKKGKEKYDIDDRATGQDVVDYYKKCIQKFESTGRVKCFFGVEYKFDEATGTHTIIPKNGTSLDVDCKKVVMVRSNVTVPSMRDPLIPIAENVRSNFVPVNEVPAGVQSGNYNNYIVFGCGKTGADAIVQLLRSGVKESQITWIVSRDVWYFVRDAMENFWGCSQTLQNSVLEANSAEEFFLIMEKHGLTARLKNPDSNNVPQVFKGPTMDREELTLMKSIKNVIRMGRAASIEGDGKIMLEKGTIDFSVDDTLLIDCMVDNVYGYDFPELLNIFEPRRINLGPITFLFNVSASASHIAFLECALKDESDEAKNERCFFARGEYAQPTIQSFVGAFYLQTKTQEALSKTVPGGGKFMLSCRTNIAAPMHHKGGFMRLMWFLYGQGAIKFSKKLYRKIESGGYKDIDHQFGIETFAPTKKEEIAV